MSFVAAAIGIGGVAAGAASYFGATQAAKTQVSAEQQALAVQQQQYRQGQAQLQPYIQVGNNATSALGQLIGTSGQQPNYSAFLNSPDYAFAQSQGNAALQNYLNANGIAGSGAGITSAINYNQGLATQQYGNYYNRLMQIATLGANAAQAGAGLSVNSGNAQANTIGNIGASQASGIVGGTNAITGALNSGVNNALLYNAINRGQVNPSAYAYGTTALSGASGGGYNPNYTTGAPA